MALEEYLVSEVTVDYADGLLSRRDALRSLTLLGLAAPAAAALLAACARDESSPAPTTSPAPSPAPGGPAGASGIEAITWAGPSVTMQGGWAAAASPKGGVLVIHENRGLNDHIRSVAARLASDGYSSLAVDLVSEKGGTAAVGDAAMATAALGEIPEARLVALMRSGIDELERRVRGGRLAVVGFCFGGGMVWRLLGAGEARLAAAVPFYGAAPDPADFSGSKAAVLAIYAEDDARVNATRDAAAAGLQKAGLPHEMRTFAGTQHAFFNDTGARHNAQAAAEAYRAMLDWFGRYLG